MGADDTARLSPTALDRLEAAAIEQSALAALSELAALCDLDCQGRWALAGELADRLKRFECTAWPRIRVGAREPTNSFEHLLAAIARCPTIPRSQRRLFDLLN